MTPEESHSEEGGERVGYSDGLQPTGTVSGGLKRVIVKCG